MKKTIKHEIVSKPLSFFKPAPYNPRKDLKPSDPEYQSLKRSITKFGHVQVLVSNKNGTLIGGHQTYKILTDLGYDAAPTVILDLPAKEEKALNVALNKVQGEWDFLKLKEILSEFGGEDEDFLETIGFSEKEMKSIVEFNPEVETAELEKNPKDAAEAYGKGLIKQIVLYFDGKHYSSVVKRLERVREIEKVEDNTSAFLRMLNAYENQHLSNHKETNGKKTARRNGK